MKTITWNHKRRIFLPFKLFLLGKPGMRKLIAPAKPMSIKVILTKTMAHNWNTPTILTFLPMNVEAFPFCLTAKKELIPGVENTEHVTIGESLLYNICLISISTSVSNEATKKISSEYWKMIVWLTLPKNMNLMYWILFAQHGFKNSKVYKECVSSLALLPPRDLQFLKTNFFLSISQKEPNFSTYI